MQRILSLRRLIVFIVTTSLIAIASTVGLYSHLASAEPLYNFRGSVVDQNGIPLSNMNISFHSSANGNDTGNGKTDANGQYNYEALPGIYENVTISFNTPFAPAPAGWPSQEVSFSSPGPFDLTNGNLNINFKVNMVHLTIGVNDSNGNPLPNAEIKIIAGQSGYIAPPIIEGSTTLSEASSVRGEGFTDSTGTFSLLVPVGTTFSQQNGQFNPNNNIRIELNGVPTYYLDAPRVINEDTTILFPQTAIIPDAPVNLSAASPTNAKPALTWDNVTNAVTYNIYRDGVTIGGTQQNNFVDESVSSSGVYSYTVTTVNSLNNESDYSDSSTVLYDIATPLITYTAVPTAVNQWNNSNVTVTFNCSDQLSGVATCSAPVTITNEGVNQTIIGTVVDAAGNTSSVTAHINVDKSAPLVSNVSWTVNPLLQGQNTILTAAVTDNLSSVATVVYTVDGGTPQNMVYDSTTATWKATFGSALAVNTYNIDVFATDGAGNVSVGTMDVLAVYNSANGYVTGHAWIIPSANDTIPITKDTSNNPAKIVVGLTNIKAATSTTPSAGSLDIRYVVKNNIDEFEFSSSAIDWLVVPDPSHASILGHGALNKYVNGVLTTIQNVNVRLDVTLSTNGSPDQVVIKIFNAGVNPNTGTPTWVISDVVVPNISKIMIKP